MSNIYLKVTIDEKSRSKNFDFLSLKKFVTRSIFAELKITKISLNFKLKNHRPGSKTVSGFSIILILKGIKVLKLKSPSILLNKNINFNKSKTESKIENPKHSFRETNLALQLV